MTLHPAFPAIAIDTLEAELRRELAYRQRAYPAMVDKGSMTAEAQAWQLAMAQAWLADLARMRVAWFTRPGTLPQPAAHGLSWADRRGAVLRELALRRRFYPQWIDKGRLDRPDAAHRFACLECLLALYEDGWDWRASNGERTRFADLAPSPAIQQARREWQALRTEIDARPGQQQKELAL